MKWLRTKLEAIELIINVGLYPKKEKKYWIQERKEVLAEILKYQLKNFCE